MKEYTKFFATGDVISGVQQETEMRDNHYYTLKSSKSLPEKWGIDFGNVKSTPNESRANLEAKLFPPKQEKLTVEPKPEPKPVIVWQKVEPPEQTAEVEAPEPLTVWEQPAFPSSYIAPGHRREWENSGIHPGIIDQNLESVNAEGAFEVLMYSPKLKRTNLGKLSAGTLKRYEHLNDGGWFCAGVDPLNNFRPMQWGCLKPNSPRQMPDGKTIKYEHPPKTETKAFFLRVPLEIWQRVAARYGVAMPSAVENISFWEWVLSHPELPIDICEGVKKAAALLSIGRIAVAIPGIYSGYRRHKLPNGQVVGNPFLIPELSVLCPQNAEVKRPINFVFDQDKKRTTRENVGKAIAITGKLFSQANCEVSVTEWDSKLGKGIDDVLVGHGEDRVNQILKNADSLDIWKVKQYAKLTYPADVTVNRQYLTEKNGNNFTIPNELIPPKSCQLLLIKGLKGGGKTELLRGYAAPFLSDGRRVLQITHRVQLGQNSADRIGIPYVTELKAVEEGELLGYTLCHHSLHKDSSAKFNPHEWEGALIILDELVQVLWDMLSSGLIASKQVEILSNFKECIRYALSTGGMLIGCDADLNDWAIDYLHNLIGFNVKQHLIVNDWKPAIDNRWEVFNYLQKSPIALVQNLVEHIKAGGKTFVLCSSQQENSVWSTQNLESYLKVQIPELQILRIDSESIADPTHPAYGCTSKLNEILPNYQVVLASPTLETGVDIKVKGHFDSVWGMFWGVQTADGVRQFLARLRENVPRHIWVNKIGLTQVGRGEITPQALYKTTDTVFRGAVDRLMSAGYDSEFDGNFQTESLNAYCQRGALINLQKRKYREVILDAIESEGHKLIDASEVYKFNADSLKALDAELKAFRDGFYLEHREKVTAIGNPDDAEFDKLKKSKVRTKEELRKLEHGSLARKYQVEVTPDLVQKNDDGWLPQIQLQYHLTMGRKFVEAKDKNAASTHLKNGDGKVWKPTFNKRQVGLRVDFLEKMGVLKLFELKEIRAKDVMPIVEFGQKYSHDLRAVGITANWNDKPISVVKNLLNNLLDLNITRVKRENVGGKREWVYSGIAADFQRDDEGQLLLDESGLPIAISDGREEVFQQWLISDIAKAEALEKEKASVTASTAIAETAPTVEARQTKMIVINDSLTEVYADNLELVESVEPVEQLAAVEVNPVEEAIGKIKPEFKPESLIGKAVRWFSEYANKVLDLGRIQAIESMENGKVTYVTTEGWFPSLDDLLNDSRYRIA